MLSSEEMTTLLTNFPKVEFAFAYGSGVIEQSGYNYQQQKKELTDYPMVDFIFVVKDSETWHQQNLLKNAHHYSSLIPMREKGIAWFQDTIPAHFWFNAYVPFPLPENHPYHGKILMKYGVINEEHAMKDLKEWTNLYLAGRLHKPVRLLQTNSQYDELLQINRDNAMNTSLLLLPEKFSEMDLYLCVAGLSYLGDIRMRVGAENPKKVSNLVTPIVNHYHNLYDGTIQKSKFFTKSSNNHFLQNTSTQSKLELVSRLPLSLKSILQRRSERERVPSINEVKNAIVKIVSRSASLQTMKGLFTAGIVKSSSYVLAKLSKRFLVKK